MKENKVTLEKVLEENKDKGDEWDIMFEYMQKNSGLINRKIIQFHKHIRSQKFKDSITNIIGKFAKGIEKGAYADPAYIPHRHENNTTADSYPKISSKAGDYISRGLDFALQTYIGGSMTRTDQEVFAKVAGKKAKYITLSNTVLITLMSYQYHAYVTGEGLFSKWFSWDADKLDTAGWVTAGVIVAANIARTARAFYNDTGYASITIDSLIINSTTYAKKLKNYLQYGYSTMKSMSGMIGDGIRTGFSGIRNGFKNSDENYPTRPEDP